MSICRNHNKPYKFYSKGYDRYICDDCIDEVGLWFDWYQTPPNLRKRMQTLERLSPSKPDFAKTLPPLVGSWEYCLKKFTELKRTMQSFVKDSTWSRAWIIEDEEYETGKIFTYLDQIESLIGELT